MSACDVGTQCRVSLSRRLPTRDIVRPTPHVNDVLLSGLKQCALSEGRVAIRSRHSHVRNRVLCAGVDERWPRRGNAGAERRRVAIGNENARPIQSMTSASNVVNVTRNRGLGRSCGVETLESCSGRTVSSLLLDKYRC